MWSEVFDGIDGESDVGDVGDLGVEKEVGDVWGSSLGSEVEDERVEGEFFMEKAVGCVQGRLGKSLAFVSNCYNNNKIKYSVCLSLGCTTQQEDWDDVRSLLKQE